MAAVGSWPASLFGVVVPFASTKGGYPSDTLSTVLDGGQRGFYTSNPFEFDGSLEGYTPEVIWFMLVFNWENILRIDENLRYIAFGWFVIIVNVETVPKRRFLNRISMLVLPRQVYSDVMCWWNLFRAPPPGATMRWQWNKFLFEDVSPIKKWWFSIVMLLCWRVIFLKVFPGRWLWSNGGCELHGFQGWQYTVLVDSFWLVWGFVYWAYASHCNLHTLVFRSWGLASDCPVLLVPFSNFDSQNIGNLNCLKEA